MNWNKDGKREHASTVEVDPHLAVDKTESVIAARARMMEARAQKAKIETELSELATLLSIDQKSTSHRILPTPIERRAALRRQVALGDQLMDASDELETAEQAYTTAVTVTTGLLRGARTPKLVELNRRMRDLLDECAVVAAEAHAWEQAGYALGLPSEPYGLWHAAPECLPAFEGAESPYEIRLEVLQQRGLI